MSKTVFKIDQKYVDKYRYFCIGYLSQILASDDKVALVKAVKEWPNGQYKIRETSK